MKMTDDLLEYIGIYVGKEYRRTITNKKDGSEKKIFGLKVKSDPNQQYGKSFTIFEGCKGFDTITEGDMVKLGYVVNEFTTQSGKACKSHTVLWIGKTDSKPEISPNQATLSQPSQSHQPKVEDDEIVPYLKLAAFSEYYVKDVPEDQWTEEHYITMLMSMILKKERKKYAETFKTLVMSKKNRETLEKMEIPEEVVEDDTVQ